MKLRIRRIKRNLAVSTVVGNMLMIAITLSLAAILVAWAGTSYGTFTGGSGLYFGQRQQALQERFVIENVFFNKTLPNPPNTLLIFVRNVGAIDIKIVALYVNGTSLSPQITSANGKGGLVQCSIVPPNYQTSALGVQGVPSSQSACEFNVVVTSILTGAALCSGTWCSGVIFTIVVTSARGNQATYTARGP